MHQCDCGCNAKILQLWQAIAALQGTLQNYTTILSGFSRFIAPTVHKLTQIRGYLCINLATGETVDIQFVINANFGVTVSSNVLLDNHKLIIY